MERYLSIQEAAEKWGVSKRRVNQYCVEGVFLVHKGLEKHGQFLSTRKNRAILASRKSSQSILNRQK